MLSERERRTLDDIERELATSDPELAHLLATSPTRPVQVAFPQVFIVIGLVMIVLGSVMVSIVLAAFGMMLTVGAVGWGLISSTLQEGRDGIV